MNDSVKSVNSFKTAERYADAIGWTASLSNDQKGEINFYAVDEKGKFSHAIDTAGELLNFLVGIHSIMNKEDISTFQKIKDKVTKFKNDTEEHQKKFMEEQKKLTEAEVKKQVDAKR